jgi:3-hydroxy-5-methyl-1-naphthoate 3-O-methyltransferase
MTGSLFNFLQKPETDPTSIYRYRDGLYAADLLTAALSHLDFFTWLNEQPSNLQTICGLLKIQERPTDVMLTLFTAMGLLEPKGGVFHVTALAREHLVKSSLWNIEPYFASLKERPVCRDMVTVLRTGKPANWGSLKNEQEWAKAMEQEAFARSFTAAMDCRGVYLAPALAERLDLRGHQHVLDIAGGSGVYACALVARHPHLRATILERPPVDRISSQSVAARGFADRISVFTGNMFADPFPSDCDVHLFSNVLHDWDFPLVRNLLEKSFVGLPTGGLIIIHDAHINAEKTGPLPVAAYSALLMNITEGKCYSVKEMEDLLTEAGFREVKYQPTVVDRSFMIARKTCSFQ